MVTLGPAGAARRRSFRLRAKTLMASVSERSRKAVISSDSKCNEHFTLHVQRTVSISQPSAGRPSFLILK